MQIGLPDDNTIADHGILLPMIFVVSVILLCFLCSGDAEPVKMRKLMHLMVIQIKKF